MMMLRERLLFIQSEHIIFEEMPTAKRSFELLLSSFTVAWAKSRRLHCTADLLFSALKEESVPFNGLQWLHLFPSTLLGG